MWQLFTELAKRAMFQAEIESLSRKQRNVGPDCLFLGLLKVEGCVAARILHELGLNLAAMQQAVDAGLPRGNVCDLNEPRNLTSSGHRVVHLAFEEMQRTGVSYIGTEHLLIGLIAEGSSVSAQLLAGHGAALEPVRAVVMRLQEGGPRREPPTSRGDEPTPAGDR